MTANTVTLTNAFEVTPGTERLFEERWEQMKAFLARQRGFVSAALQRSSDPGARFQFTTSTTFKTQDQLWGALRQTELSELAQTYALPHDPEVYDLFLRPQSRVA